MGETQFQRLVQVSINMCSNKKERPVYPIVKEFFKLYDNAKNSTHSGCPMNGSFDNIDNLIVTSSFFPAIMFADTQIRVLLNARGQTTNQKKWQPIYNWKTVLKIWY